MDASQDIRRRADASVPGDGVVLTALFGNAFKGSSFSSLSRGERELRPAGTLSPFVDVLQLLLGPGNGALGGLAFHDLGEHVKNDVLCTHLRGLAVVGPSIASITPILWQLAENRHGRIGLPHGMLLPF